jgi:hypothetical protein
VRVTARSPWPGADRDPLGAGRDQRPRPFPFGLVEPPRETGATGQDSPLPPGRLDPLADRHPPCTASELDTGAVTCGLASWQCWGRIAVCVSSPSVSDHDQDLWLAAPAGPRPVVQERRDPGSPSRTHGATPSGRPAQARLGRPRGPGRADPAPASLAARPSACHTGHAAGLAPPPDHTQLDVSEPARPPGNQPGDPQPGAGGWHARIRPGGTAGCTAS